MEHQFSLPLLTSFLLFVFLLLIWKKSKSKSSPSNLPPGPWKLPLIGNMHQLVPSLPHHRLRDLAMIHGPIMRLQLGEIPVVVLSSPEVAKEVMKVHDFIFAQRPFFLVADIVLYKSQDIAFAAYGDYWRQIRKVCILELLSTKRVQSFRSIREEEVSRFIQYLSSTAGFPVNLTVMLVSLTNCITSRAAFGKLRNQQDAFFPVLQKIGQMIGVFTLADVFPSVKLLQVISGTRSKLKKLHQEADKLLENIIDEHKARRATLNVGSKDEAHDLVDVLLNTQEDGDLEFPITADNIKAVILDVFIAGSESSSSVVEWAMSEMMKNPRLMEKAQAEVRKVFSDTDKISEESLYELKYLNLVIKETLRLHPPAPLLLPRVNREKVEIHGYELPVNTIVLINAWAIGRDSQYWPKADTFDPERFLDSSIDFKGTDFKYLPFGAGRRICPGIQYGMATVELTLASLLYHFDWTFPDGVTPENFDMEETFGGVARRRNALHLIPVPHRPLPVK